MEFWGIEVKSGKPLKVNPGDGWLIHLSQAAIGESSKSDKGNDSVPIFVNVDEKKLVIGTLSSTSFPQIPFDLVFHSEFELSHNWKNGSVYFTGYKTEINGGFDSDSEPETDSEDVPLPISMNGSLTDKTVEAKPKDIKLENSITKPDGKGEKAKKSEKRKKNEKVKIKVSDDEDDDEDDSGSGDDSESDSDDMKMDSDSEDDDKDISSDEEDESAKKKTPASKKRPSEASMDLPKSKKEKISSPRIIGTPHPSKGPAAKAGKKAAALTPSSDSKFFCETCNKNFKSDQGLASHRKDKHNPAA